MRQSTQALKRLLVLAALLTALFFYGSLLTVPGRAAADGLASVKSCDINASSSSAVDCTIVLNFSIDSGGSWSGTITDMAAVVTACDGSAAQATCKAGGNTVEFDCPSGCAQNSTYMITVTASSATAMQQTFTVLSAGTSAAGTGAGSSAGSITVGAGGAGGYSSTMLSGSATGHTPPQQSMSSSGPQGGMCVGGSFPGPNGCTSGGPLSPSVGASLLGAYSGCAGVYGCGGYGGYGYGGGCLLGPTLCGGVGAGFGAGFGGACAFAVTCSTTCTSTSCTVNITSGTGTTTRNCIFFGGSVVC